MSRGFVVRRLIVLSAVFSASAMAAAIGTCAPSMVSSVIGNPCRLGDAMFSNFSYSGNIDPAKVSVNFQVANGAEYRVILAPVSDAGFLTHFKFSNTISSASDQVVGLKALSDFSIDAAASGHLGISNSDGTDFDLGPGHQSGGPTAITATNSVTTSAALDPVGGGGVSSVELGYLLRPNPVGLLVSAPVAVPEPSSWALFALGFIGLGFLRKRSV